MSFERTISGGIQCNSTICPLRIEGKCSKDEITLGCMLQCSEIKEGALRVVFSIGIMREITFMRQQLMVEEAMDKPESELPESSLPVNHIWHEPSSWPVGVDITQVQRTISGPGISIGPFREEGYPGRR
jgi:hypothetical protein